MNEMSAPPQVLAKTSENLVPDALRADLTANNIVPLWELNDAPLGGGPTEPLRVWQWKTLRPIIEQASTIADPSIVERRVLGLANPDLRSPFHATTGALSASVQSTRPGESARPHRHTMNALRLGLEGSTGETVVDGKPCLLSPGDLVVTPAWTWHGHRNEGSEHTVWLDVLDVPFHVGIGTAKFQPGPSGDAYPAFDDKVFATAGVVPVLPDAASLPHSPIFRYAWSDVVRALEAAPAAADGSRRVRYVNPLTGGSIMGLIDCYAMELEDGQETIPFRSSAHTLCSVIEGQGTTRFVGRAEQTERWEAKDLFNVPQHGWVSYRAEGGKARLFFATNRELFLRLGLLVEEQQGANQ